MRHLFIGCIGSLVVLCLAACGTARRLVGDMQPVLPPAHELTVTPTQGVEGETVTFQVIGDFKALDNELDFSWDFGDLATQRRFSKAEPEVTLVPVNGQAELTGACHVLISYTLGQQVEV